MRLALAAAALCLLASARLASAQAGSDSVPAPAVPVPANGGIPLVKGESAAWRYQLVTAPALPTQIGALATSGLDVVLGRAPKPIELLGAPATAPAQWPYGLDHATRATGALAPPAPADQRIAAMFALTTFELTADQSGLRVIEIRLRYRDGCAVWLNGVEIGRRALTPNASTGELAARPHGP
ncbi:MAG: hypothetical protein HOV81_12400, partial [Kofleriaceae bacterium]|nr:hypothetical protein [Kofleriaceae bacterium]